MSNHGKYVEDTCAVDTFGIYCGYPGETTYVCERKLKWWPPITK